MKTSSIDMLPIRNESHCFLMILAVFLMFALPSLAVHAVELPGVGPVDIRYQAEGEGLVIDVGLQYIKGKQLKKDVGIDIYVISNKDLTHPGIQKPKVYTGSVPEPAANKYATFKISPSKLHSVNITHDSPYWVIVDAFGESSTQATRRVSDKSFIYLDAEVLRKKRDDALLEKQRLEQLRKAQFQQEQQRQEQANLEKARLEQQHQKQLLQESQRKEQLQKEQQAQSDASKPLMPIVVKDTPAASGSNDDLDLGALLGGGKTADKEQGADTKKQEKQADGQGPSNPIRYPIDPVGSNSGQGPPSHSDDDLDLATLLGGVTTSLPGDTGAPTEMRPDNGLIAYFPFDKNVNDASGNGNHGVINGNVALVAAKFGNGAKFNGINSVGGTKNPDFIKVGNSPSLRFDNAMGVSYWVRIDGDRAQTGADCSGSAISERYGAVLAKSGDRSGWYTMEYAESSSFGINPYAGGQGGSMSAIPTAYRNFRHIVYSVSGNAIQAFVNGRLISTTKGNVNFSSANANDLFIGVQNNSGGACLPYWYPLDGVIDELRIYNRSLSESEVSALYERGLNTDIHPPALCTPEYAPVCGKDRRTYHNACEAGKYNAAVDYVGACIVKPLQCQPDGIKVCGTDGRTYPDRCQANSAGVQAASTGACIPSPPPEAKLTIGVSNPNPRLNSRVEVNLFGTLPTTPVDIYLFVRKAETGAEYFYFNRNLNEPGQVQPWRRNVMGPGLPEVNPYFGFDVTQTGKSLVGVKVLPAGSAFDLGSQGLHEQSFTVMP